MSSHDMFQRITTQPAPSLRWKEGVLAGSALVFEPTSKGLRGFPSQGCATLLAAFALTPNTGACSGHNVTTARIDKFRATQSSLQGHGQLHGLCAPPTLKGLERLPTRPSRLDSESPRFGERSVCLAWQGFADIEAYGRGLSLPRNERTIG